MQETFLFTDHSAVIRANAMMTYMLRIRIKPGIRHLLYNLE